MKKKIQRNDVFSGLVGDALQNYLGNDTKQLADNFWQSEAIATALANAANAKKSMTVLSKHLPKSFHPYIRFAQPKTTWYLNVEKGVTAAQINMLLDELLLKIAKDIGYAPRIQVSVQPSPQRWLTSGFPLVHPEKPIKTRLTEDDAQALLTAFIGS